MADSVWMYQEARQLYPGREPDPPFVVIRLVHLSTLAIP